MSTASESAASFRCPVQPENATATLRVGFRKVSVSVIDTSVEGFTLNVPKRSTKRLRHDSKWILEFNGERTLVHPEWMFNAPNGDAQLGVRRVEDLTPPPTVGRSWFFSSSGGDDGGKAGMALGGVVMLLIAIACLPGIGDDLGTAPLVRGMLGDTMTDLSISVRRFFNS